MRCQLTSANQVAAIVVSSSRVSSKLRVMPASSAANGSRVAYMGVNEAGWHEVAGASLDPFGNDLAVASEMDEDQIWAGLSQLIAVDMFESGTCHDCSVISTFGHPSGEIS